MAKNFLKGVCNSRCFNAKGSKCKCRCSKVYHGLGVKKAGDLTDYDKECLRKLNPVLISDFIPVMEPKAKTIRAVPQETKGSMALTLAYAQYEKGDIKG